MHETKGEIQHLGKSSIDLSAYQQAGKMIVHSSLSKEKAMMSRKTGENIGYGE
jgi:hypothetical protein